MGTRRAATVSASIRSRGVRRRHLLTAGAVAVAVACAAGCGDDGPSASERREDQVAGAAEGAGLPADVTDFLADAAAGVDGTYQVAYDVADPAGGTQRLTITQAPPDRRVEVDRPDGPDTVTIGTEEGTHECVRPTDDQPYTCELVAGAASEGIFAEERIDALGAALSGAATSYTFAIEEQDVAGVDARCLVATRRAEVEDPALGAEATICLSPEGAQLLVDTPSGTLRAVAYAPVVPDDAFALPGS